MGLPRNDHGGRIYAADPEEGAGFAAWLRLKLKAMFGRTASPDMDRHPAGEGPSPYSTLGDDQDPFPPSAGRPVFPMADWTARRPGALRRRAPTPPTAAGKADHASH
jgi:hypothetical protein